MPHKTPAWWSGAGLLPVLLSPLGLLYGLAVRSRFALTKAYKSRLPVVCIGNFTVGGAGKTPLAIAVARLLRETGRSPAFLTRGYGGRLPGPVKVDLERHNAADVGDEALLLAKHAPVVVSRNRPAGARFIEAMGADIVVMDDGFQTPTLAKDLNIIAVDGGFGVGNGYIFPAGPLRAPLGFQLARSDMLVRIGDGPHPSPAADKPVLNAELKPAVSLDWLSKQPVVAYCGIGRPEKFFATLRKAGAELAGSIVFADHHPYTAEDAERLLNAAREYQAQLVTTEKDYVRLVAGGQPLAQLRQQTRLVCVELSFASGDREKLAGRLRRIAA